MPGLLRCMQLLASASCKAACAECLSKTLSKACDKHIGYMACHPAGVQL